MSLLPRTGRIRTCTVCGTEIRFPVAAAPDAEPLCGSAPCRMLMERRPDLDPQSFRFLVQIRARQVREHHERERIEAEQRAEKHAREQSEHEAIWQALARRPSALSTPRYARMVLPKGPRRTSPLPARRRALYRAHLIRVIAEARSDAPDTIVRLASPAPAHVRLGAVLCGVCGGGCCPLGGDDAFVSMMTIRRVMRERPELTPDAVLDEYLRHLPQRSVTGSCVNQTTRGCSLPRELRSDICNGYFCLALKNWQAQQAGEPRPEGVLVIQRQQDQWNKERPDLENPVVGVSVVSESGVRRLRVTAP